jgi:competence protein ComEC
VTLHPGATLKIHTASGHNTAADLYWGRTSPLWASGELAALYDAQNVARAFYRVP